MRHSLVGAIAMLATALLAVGAIQARTEVALDKGRVLAEQGDIQGALAAYADVVAENPDWAEAHARLGGMQLLGRAYSDAVQSFQNAIRLGDAGARPFVGMGMAYLHMGQYRVARAALLEAKVRGTKQTADVDRVLSWLDKRDEAIARERP